MGNIVLLDDLTINQIAAGEVIERPANVVKELVENSIDAGASTISIEIQNGGITYIRITDNGKGIAPDDVEIAFERHATSKIREADDLIKVMTMGFRGEALASIAAISKVELITRTSDSEMGTKVIVEGGNIISKEECGAPVGTTITIKELFYNTPVRYKFLKRDFTEGGYIMTAVERIALVNPAISIKLVDNKKEVLQTSGNNNLIDVVYNVFKKDVAQNVVPVDFAYENIKVTGVVGKPDIARSNRSNQMFYVNGRFIKDKTLTAAAEEAYRTMIPHGKFGFCILNIEIPPEQVDVNVHPAKLEVRFAEEGKVFKAIHYAIKNTLLGVDLIRDDANDPVNKTDNDENELNNNLTISDNKEENQVIAKPLFTSKFATQKLDNLTDDNNNILAFKDYRKEILDNNDENERAIKTPSEDEVLNNIDEEKTDKFSAEISDNSDKKKKTLLDLFKGKQQAGVKEETLKNNEYIIEVKDNGDKAGSIIRNLTSEDDKKAFAAPLAEEVEINDPIALENLKVSNTQTKIDSIYEQELIEKAPIPEYQILGVAFNTYILIQLDDDIYILDQHAAHERVLYEKIKENFYRSGGKEIQMLLLPDILEVSKKDMHMIKSHLDLFEQAGFAIEEFGENTIKINGVPVICFEMNTKDLFMDIIDGMDITNRTNTQEIEEKFIATVACKAAVKANMKLDEKEIRGLLDQLMLLENPFSCPHGRPTAIRISKTEIEKKFARR